MPIGYDQELLDQIIKLQLQRESLYEYQHSMIWLALAKNIGEAFDFYYRHDDHYIKELGDALVNILMLLKIQNVDIEKVINRSLFKTKESISKSIKNNGKYCK